MKKLTTTQKIHFIIGMLCYGAFIIAVASVTGIIGFFVACLPIFISSRIQQVVGIRDTDCNPLF